jgi:acyl-CoA hydrolase
VHRLGFKDDFGIRTTAIYADIDIAHPNFSPKLPEQYASFSGYFSHTTERLKNNNRT